MDLRLLAALGWGAALLLLLSHKPALPSHSPPSPPPLAPAVYRRTYRRCLAQNAKFYQRFPMDVERAQVPRGRERCCCCCCCLFRAACFGLPVQGCPLESEVPASRKLCAARPCRSPPLGLPDLLASLPLSTAHTRPQKIVLWLAAQPGGGVTTPMGNRLTPR